MSAIVRLSSALDSVVADLASLVRAMPVHYSSNQAGEFIILAPAYRWGERSAEQQHQHLQIVRRYKIISELLLALLIDAPKSLKREFEQGDKRFTTWLELGSNWSISPDKETNERALRESTEGLRSVVKVLAAGPQDQLILIPDTNSLLAEPDPTAYRAISKGAGFDFLLLPTVLKELDELKMLHRNPDVRDKAQKVITRIKGWRIQGPLLEGVVVDKTIRVRAIHDEPNMTNSLSWLDAHSADDRIVAATLHVQSILPSARVVLVTGDINLQNKSDAALIEVAEL